MKRKKLRMAVFGLGALELVLVAIFVFLSIWWYGFSYPAFENIAKTHARIPGLGSGISPQGICALPANDYGYDFAMSGYIAGKPSRVYLFHENAVGGGEDTFVTFLKDGEPVETHFGGVTTTDKYMYIASGKEIIRIALADVYKTPNGGAVEIEDSFEIIHGEKDFGAAFCYVYGDELFVGEFYRPGNYETDKSHYVSVNGKTNHAFIYVYDIDEHAEGGVALKSPTKVISVPDQVQGIAVTEDKIYLSTSYGLPDSKLFIYENKLNGEPDKTVSLLPEMSFEHPLYILEPKEADLVMPCMSEEICVKDGRLYILFESMSKKYRYVVHYRITQLCSIALVDLG